MKKSKLFSIKMRASREGEHISGAERIVIEDDISKVVKDLSERAVYHPKGQPNIINIKIELLEEEPLSLKLLDIYEIEDRESYDIKELLTLLFRKAKIDEVIGLSAFRAVLSGASPAGTVMRGAMVVDVDTGLRLEPDKFRGIRASYMDIVPEVEKKLKYLLGKSFTKNLKDAVVLSTKVLSHKNVVAELCVSDDPDYTTGYFSIKGLGYIRIHNIKPLGLPKGGRVFFVKNLKNRHEFINYIEEVPVLVTEIGSYFVSPLDKVLDVPLS